MSHRSTTAITISFLLLAGAALAQDSPVDAGIAAFNNGNYSQALESFRRAERGGNSSDSLQYNIAASLYRLDRHEEAREIFLRLVEQPEWQVLARYNLGLVAEALGNREEARRYYALSADQDEHERVREMASRKLAALDERRRAAAEPDDDAAPAAEGSGNRSWTVLARLTGGHDSNATSLADDLLENRSSARDSYHEQLLYGHWQFSGQAGDGNRVYVLGFNRGFNEFDHLDSQVLGVGAVHERPLGEYQAEAGMRINTTRLDSSVVADQFQMHAGVSRSFQLGTVALDYVFSRYEPGDEYPQVEGGQHRLGLEWEKRLDQTELSARYRVENNNREDLQRGGAFASYSPRSQEVRLEVRQRFSDSLNAGLRLEHVLSRYQGVNRLRDTDGQVREERRINRRGRARVDVEYSLNPNWHLKGEYRYTDRRDNFSLYTYDKHRASATVEYRF